MVVAGLSLSACTKKSNLNSSSSAVNSSNVASEALPAEALSVSANSSPSASGSKTNQPQSYQTIDSFVTEKTLIDDTYRQNYQVALEDAQRALKGSAKFCGTIIKFYGAQLTSQNIEQFLFYNDDFSKDYYWLVELNSYGTVKKTRSFIARRDIASDIKCAANPSATLAMFSSTYEQFTATEKFKMIDPGIIALTTIYPMDASWNIVVTDNAGAVSANEILNVTAAASVTSAQSAAVQSVPSATRVNAASPQATETDNLNIF